MIMCGLVRKGVLFLLNDLDLTRVLPQYSEHVPAHQK